MALTPDSMLLHLPTFLRANAFHQATPWHALTPQARLLCALASVFAIALTPNGRWGTWGIYGLGVWGAIALSHAPLTALLPRVAVEFVFVGVALLGTLFHQEGQVLWSWGWVQVTAGGLTVLGSVAVKVALSLLMLNLLVLTTPIPALLQAFTALGAPSLLVAIGASMYRYLSLLVGEFAAMHRAATARNLTLTPRTARLVLGNTIGVLFVRTYERGERIYQAMLARGYRGLPAAEKRPRLGKRDLFALTVTGSIVWLGQVI